MYDDLYQLRQMQPVQLNKVSSLEEVNQARIPANSVVPFFHTGEDIFFIKSTDPAGMHTDVRAFRFQEVDLSELTPVSMSRADYNKMMEVFNYVKQLIPQQSAPDEKPAVQPAGS